MNYLELLKNKVVTAPEIGFIVKDELSTDEGFSYNGGEYCKSCLHDVLIADGVIGELNA